NKDILVTYPNSGLYRELLRNKQISLTPYIYNGYRLSLGMIKTNKIGVNKILSNCVNLHLEQNIKNLVTFNIMSPEDLEGYDIVYSNSNEWYDKSGINISWKDYDGSGTGNLIVIYYAYEGEYDPVLGHPSAVFYTVSYPLQGSYKEIQDWLANKRAKGIVANIYTSYITGNSGNAYRVFFITYYDSKNSHCVTRTITYDKVTQMQSESDNSIDSEEVTTKQVEITTDDGITINIDVPDYINTDKKIFNFQNKEGFHSLFASRYTQIVDDKRRFRFTYGVPNTDNMEFFFDIPLTVCAIERDYINDICVFDKSTVDDSIFIILFIFDKKIAIRAIVDENVLKELVGIDAENYDL
ncbi:MAG: hypothetical protein IJ597_01230, partial [Synergistaceae bacterium]|nr:hypothetical protein [Synergistaceae bacterium]